MFVRSAVRVFTDRQTDRHTNDVKTITPVADAGCKKASGHPMLPLCGGAISKHGSLNHFWVHFSVLLPLKKEIRYRTSLTILCL